MVNRAWLAPLILTWSPWTPGESWLLWFPFKTFNHVVLINDQKSLPTDAPHLPQYPTVKWILARAHQLNSYRTDWLLVDVGGTLQQRFPNRLFSSEVIQLIRSNVESSPRAVWFGTPGSGAVTRKSNRLREGSFAAGAQWEVLIVFFATCSLKLRENCNRPLWSTAGWVMTLCVSSCI